MRRTAIAIAVVSMLVAGTTAAGDPGTDKARVDSRIDRLEDRIGETRAREGVLTSEISALTGRIRDLEARVSAEQARLVTLQSQLAGARERLDELGAALREQSRRLTILEREHDVALARLEWRVREVYLTDRPDVFSFLVGVSSWEDVLDHIDILRSIGRQDNAVVDRVARAEDAMRENREQTRLAREEQARATREIATRAAEQRATRDRLAAGRDQLGAARADKQETLDSIVEDREDFLREVAALEQESTALAARIRAAQEAAAERARIAAEKAAAAAPAPASGSSDPALQPQPSSGSGVSASGFAWPVQGPVTSGFGPRWGRMHEGIDISVPTGTPVRASLPGTVIEAGWHGGYGNLVVVDHGNGLATAYAHNSSFAVSPGQYVGQGDVIAYAGSTGNSSGPHVHFEVRVNGAAVDPLGYL